MMGMLRSPIRSEKLTGECFMLSGLMLDNMRQNAEIGVHAHGSPAWKVFGRALYEEHEAGVRPTEQEMP